jgi:hypothetical protein
MDHVKGIAEVAKTYPEEFRPVARELAEVLTKTLRGVNITLDGIAWSAGKIAKVSDYLKRKVIPKLSGTPHDRIVRPKLSILGPALEAVAYKAEEPELEEMFANLLATAMDAGSAPRIHPAFVEFLKQMTPDEARLLLHISRDPAAAYPVLHVVRQSVDERGDPIGEWETVTNWSLLQHVDGLESGPLVARYLDNLARMEIIQFKAPGQPFSDARTYEDLEKHPEFQELMAKLTHRTGYKTEYRQSGFTVTFLGRDFIKYCVRPYEERTATVLDE